MKTKRVTRTDLVRLIVFRLYDRTYGERGNPKTLMVYLRTDDTIGYSFYSGWQDSGMGFSIENLQMQKSLPMASINFYDTLELCEEIKACLRTGCGSNKISSFEILNALNQYR